MQQREKTLLIVLLGALGLWGLLTSGILRNPFQSLIQERNDLTDKVAAKNNEVAELAEMQVQLMKWSVDSLPPDPLNAQRGYAEWLVDLARMSGFREIEPKLGNRSPAAQVYTSIPVTIIAKATLRELATFLYHFERTGLLHRIIRCDVASTDTEGDPDLVVTITAEGIALRDASERARVFPRLPLVQAIDAQATEIQIEPSSAFPPNDTLRVKIGQEYLHVTKRDGARWTVVRGADSTTAADHAAGEFVEHAPLKRNLDPQSPQSIADYERLLASGPFVKPRPPFVYRPQLASIADQTLLRGSSLTLQAKLTGWDPAQGPPVYQLDDFSPGSMQIDADGKITWSPAATTETGDYPVQVIVSSKADPNVELTASFNVTLRDPNLPPQVTLPLQPPVAWIGRTWTLTAQGNDPEQPDGLSYSLAGQPPQGLTINPATGVLNWEVPESIEPGTVPVSVQVTDRGEPPLSAIAMVNVTVADDPRPFTYLAGCMGQPGKMTALVYDRSSNKSWYLKVGDEFRLADIAGKVAEVGDRTLDIDTPQGRLHVLMDVPLSEAKLAPTAAETTTSTSATADAPTEEPSADDRPITPELAPSTAPEPAHEPAADR